MFFVYYWLLSLSPYQGWMFYWHTKMPNCQKFKEKTLLCIGSYCSVCDWQIAQMASSESVPFCVMIHWMWNAFDVIVKHHCVIEYLQSTVWSQDLFYSMVWWWSLHYAFWRRWMLLLLALTHLGMCRTAIYMGYLWSNITRLHVHNPATCWVSQWNQTWWVKLPDFLLCSK